MSNNTSEPFLVELGAGTREPASNVNLDVSGTTGPDYLGQQTVDVPGHSRDRPGVQSRLPENTDPDLEHTHTDVQKMDTGEELPVLLSSSMSTGPIEGTQGSYTEIVEGECPRCGYDRIKVAVVTMAGERQETCNACGAQVDHRSENGYRMPSTEKESLRRMRRIDDTEGPVTKVGEYGPRSRITHGNEVYRHSDTGLLKIFEHGRNGGSVSRTSITEDMLRGILTTLEDERNYVTEFVHEEMEGMQVKPSLGSDNPNAVDAGIIKERFSIPYQGVRLWIDMEREIMRDNRPIHFSPRVDGVAI